VKTRLKRGKTVAAFRKKHDHEVERQEECRTCKHIS